MSIRYQLFMEEMSTAWMLSSSLQGRTCSGFWNKYLIADAGSNTPNSYNPFSARQKTGFFDSEKQLFVFAIFDQIIDNGWISQS